MRFLKRCLSLMLALILCLGIAPDLTLWAWESGGTEGASNGASNAQGIPAGVPISNIVTRYGVGYRFYICPDISQICVNGHLIASDAAAAVLDGLAVNSKAMWANITADSVNMWDYSAGTASTIKNDPSGVHGIPGLGSFFIVGNDYQGAQYSSILDAMFKQAGDTAVFQQILDYFGVAVDDINKAVIVCEPFYVCASGDDSILFAVTYQQARSGLAAGRGGAGAFHWMKTPGTTLNQMDDWAGNGSNGFTCKIHKLGDIWQVLAPGEGGGVPADGSKRAANAGYHFYGPGLGNTTITEEEPELETEEADLVLLDYELNHVYESVFEQKRGIQDKAYLKIRPDMWTNGKDTKTVGPPCNQKTDWYDGTVYTETTTRESSASGPIVSKDNKLGVDKVILKRPGANSTTRSGFRKGYTINTTGISGVCVDYSINLTRDLFKDARVYSNFSPQTCDQDWLETILALTSGDSVLSKKLVKVKRNSMMLLDKKLDDKFTWKTVYTKTGGIIQYAQQEAKTAKCGGHTKEKDGKKTTSYCGGDADYHPIVKTNMPLLLGGDAPITEFTLKVHSIAYKYQTEPMPTGYADKKTERLTYTATEKDEGSDKIKTPYKYSIVKPTKVTLGYFPEVPMLTGYRPGPSWSTPDFRIVRTIGEEKRSSASSMLCLYRFISDPAYDVDGTCYSDTAVGGSAGLSSQSNGRIALTAGGDFTVKCDTRFQLHLYGYALDLVDSSDSEWAQRFNSVDVKSDWGSSGTKEKLLNEYKDWAYEMLNPRNYQADYTMKLGGKVYNTFSATVGGFSSKSSQSYEDGVYYLTFKHGALEHDDQYNALVSQISSDYGSDEDLWGMSTIENAVINAIEHDNAEVNKSQVQTVGTSAKLGNGTHWYDEEVRTIVVRRFYTQPANFLDIIAHDKMDIGTAQEGFTDADGSFDLTLYFENSKITGLNEIEVYGTVDDSYYTGSSLSANFDRSISTGGVILTGTHVKNADFRVTQSTTATGSR